MCGHSWIILFSFGMYNTIGRYRCQEANPPATNIQRFADLPTSLEYFLFNVCNTIGEVGAKLHSRRKSVHTLRYRTKGYGIWQESCDCISIWVQLWIIGIYACMLSIRKYTIIPLCAYLGVKRHTLCCAIHPHPPPPSQPATPPPPRPPPHSPPPPHPTPTPTPTPTQPPPPTWC